MDEFSKNRVLIVVSGGVANYICDPGVHVEVFDWDNYENETEEGQAMMALPAYFADLASTTNLPTKTE